MRCPIRVLGSSLLTFSVLAGASASAQQTGTSTELPPLDDLKAPPSPAFVLLGISPSKIERPQAVRPLVLSALSAISTEGFPKNYAVEFAPYWLGTPQLSFDDYYKSGIAKAIPRHLSLSVATTPLGNTPDAGTALGFGVRTLPLPGRPHPRLEPLKKRVLELQPQIIDEEGFFGRRRRLVTLLQEAQGAAAKETASELATKPVEDLIDKMIDIDLAIEKLEAELVGIAEDREELGSLPGSQRDERARALNVQETTAKSNLEKKRQERQGLGKELVKAIEQTEAAKHLATEKQFEVLVSRYDQAQRVRVAKLESQLKAAALAIQELDTQRVGPLLAVATALAWDIPANDTDLTSLSRVGFWLTPGYRIVSCSGSGTDQKCSTTFDVLGVVRYLDDRRASGAGDAWELGARVVWQARSQLAVSAEWLGRTGGDENESGSRIVGVAEYEINESAFLYASFGRDFEDTDARRNLVSTIGVTFGFGKKPIIVN